MKKKIIVRIAEGLGNQLFMFANAFALSKKNNFDLLIDNESGFLKKKNRQRQRKYSLNIFNINFEYTNHNYKFNSYIKDILRKFYKKFDFFKKKKLFLIEHKDSNKQTFFKNISLLNTDKEIFVEGHFESEKYFDFCKNELKNYLSIRSNLLDNKNKYISLLRAQNSVSIHVRRHRFSEELKEKKFTSNIKKSENFTKSIISYINRGVNYFKKNTNNPVFFIWSNDFEGLDQYFNTKEFIFLKNNNNISMDFHLFSLCKHFIVGASSFHWWGAWLNKNPNKICIRPSEIHLNPSSNSDFWPSDWKKI